MSLFLLGCVMVFQHCTHNALVGSAWPQTWSWWIHSPWLLKGWVWRCSVDLSASSAHCPHPSRLQLAGAAAARSINQQHAPEYLLHNNWCIFMFATTLCHPANKVSWWEGEQGQGSSSWCLLASFYLFFLLPPCLWLPKIPSLSCFSNVFSSTASPRCAKVSPACFLLWCLLPLHPCSANKSGCVPAKALQGLNEQGRMIVIFEHVN